MTSHSVGAEMSATAETTNIQQQQQQQQQMSTGAADHQPDHHQPLEDASTGIAKAAPAAPAAAPAEAATNKQQPDIAGTTCMELALEGERLCQTGDLKNGVKFFEEAIKVSTQDDRTLSAIYSQLGNAYFYLEDYQRALEYHKQDVTLVHSIGDEAAEAKACGNLGNTFKMLNKFDEAAVYCRRYLEISRKLGDVIGEGRALYNLGNVYHVQGKRMIGSGNQESTELPHDIKSSLQRAIEYYEANLKVVTALKDPTAMGRAYGNLGNTHYLLGNFRAAVESHEKRLELAKQIGDKSAERRAHLNLGNANVFLGNFAEAIQNYSSTLTIAQELNDKHTEAHSCYSLANTYTFLRDYKSAIAYHLKYLDLIKELDDKLGEGRACWSLVNIYQMVNDPESALTYAKRHYEIARLLGDETGLTSARANIEELEDTISQKQSIQVSSNNNNNNPSSSAAAAAEAERGCGARDEIGAAAAAGGAAADAAASRSASIASTAPLLTKSRYGLSPDKRQEQEQRRFKKQLNSTLAADIDGLAAVRRRGKTGAGVARSSSSERLFDMIAHFQSSRIDDQRCEILKRPIQQSSPAAANEALSAKTSIKSRSALAKARGNGGGHHRAGSDDKENSNNSRGSSASSAENFAYAQQQHRASQPSITNPMNAVSAAASAIKATYRKASLVAYPTTTTNSNSAQSIQAQRRPTVSAEHREQLFDLIAGAQNQRMEEQRASLPALTLTNGALRFPPSGNGGGGVGGGGGGSANLLLSRRQTVDQPEPPPSAAAAAATSHRMSFAKPDTIYEDGPRRHKEQRSQSIVPGSLNFKTPTTASSSAAISATVEFGSNNSKSNSKITATPNQQSATTKPKLPKLSRHFQTIDSSDASSKVQDEKFLDNLMKLQSTRFDDQRSEFPKKNRDNNVMNKQSEREKGQVDNFFNLIVKFQSDRIDDQRSAPPTKSKNI